MTRKKSLKEEEQIVNRYRESIINILREAGKNETDHDEATIKIILFDKSPRELKVINDFLFKMSIANKL